MISRDFSELFNSYLAQFPAVLIMGARQVGKTTFLKNHLKKTHNYVLLENPDTRELAINDPKTFFKNNPAPLIIDEFQYAPQLVNYLQELIDNNRKLKGQYILTGSQNFQMMSQVTQSLAGRVGILTIYGLSSSELKLQNVSSKNKIGELMLKGFYPEIWSEPNISSYLWYSSYVQTFLERDLYRLSEVGDLQAFNKFLKLAALRTGQVLNYADLAADCSISPPTAQKWISILERAYVIKLVSPYINNATSRVKKAKKLYFLDPGLACYLMGYRSVDAILEGPHSGALFETLVYSDFIKRYSIENDVEDIFYLQTKSKVGVDFVILKNQKRHFCEVKFSSTYSNNLTEQLTRTHKEFKNKDFLYLVMLTEKNFDTKIGIDHIQVKNWDFNIK
ncbi:MAG: ATP-binding protein [Pseudobdellovibrio sp.]